MKYLVMENLATILSNQRVQMGLKIKDVASKSNIDQALLSKFESGKRIPTKDQSRILSEVLQLDFTKVEAARLAEKVISLVQYEPMALEVLQAAESRIEYLVQSQTFELPSVSAKVQSLLDEVDSLRAQWLEKKPLNKTQVRKMEEYFRVKYTFDSNRIEGNTLTLQETHLVINEGVTIGGKSMREHLEAINHSEAVEFLSEVVSSKERITERLVLELHAIILKGIDRENAGKYRSVPVRISGSDHVPPQPFMVPKLMEDFYDNYQRQKGNVHPVILAAELHERLVSIHPFVDGNGRTSRLLMNMVLLQHGYPIAILKGDTDARRNYYKVLEEVQLNNNSEPFFLFIATAVRDSLREHLEWTV